ncbi:MAG: TatD family hydrolase [Candidatus Absconditabacterales bacterium]
MIIDAHCHLNAAQLSDNWHNHIRDFVGQEGKGLSIIGTEQEDSKHAVALMTQIISDYPSLFVGATIGIHPEYAEQHQDTTNLEQAICDLEELYAHHKQHIIGIGEIGTDLHREQYVPHHTTQKTLFRAQCELARKLDLPIIIHSRDDFAGTLDVVKDFVDLKIYYHCWGYGPQELQVLQNTIPHDHLRIGFCGNITYPKAQELRDSFQYCLDHDVHILLETDSPYLAAQAIRGTTNTPAQIIYTYDYIAQHFGISIDTLKKHVYNNFMKLYFPHATITGT